MFSTMGGAANPIHESTSVAAPVATEIQKTPPIPSTLATTATPSTDEEHAVGLRCIAAPIFDETGDCIGVASASGPTARIAEERIAQLGALVLKTSRAISAEMGASAATRAGTRPNRQPGKRGQKEGCP